MKSATQSFCLILAQIKQWKTSNSSVNLSEMKPSGCTGKATALNFHRPMPPHTAIIWRDSFSTAQLTSPSTASGFIHNKRRHSATHSSLRYPLATTIQPAARICSGNAIKAYDQLESKLSRKSISFKFPLPQGGFANRTFSLTNLEYVAASQMYNESDRMMFTRALAAYTSKQDITPLARLLYIDLAR